MKVREVLGALKGFQAEQLLELIRGKSEVTLLPEFQEGITLRETDHFKAIAGYKGGHRSKDNERIYILGKDDLADEIIGECNFHFQSGRPMDSIDGKASLRFLYEQHVLDRWLKSPFQPPLLAIYDFGSMENIPENNKLEQALHKVVEEMVHHQRIRSWIAANPNYLPPNMEELEHIHSVLKSVSADPPFVRGLDYMASGGETDKNPRHKVDYHGVVETYRTYRTLVLMENHLNRN